jgi:acyl-CoA thioester hydrolase
MAHQHALRVYYEDTDVGGVVYYANYLKFFERGRTEALRALGVDLSALMANHGVLFVVRRCVIDFSAAAKFDDLLTIATDIISLKGARITMNQSAWRESERKPLVTMHVELALINSDGRPQRPPQWLRGLLDNATGGT